MLGPFTPGWRYDVPFFSFLFSVSYVGERPWWPIESLNKGRKKKAKAKREIRSSLSTLDLKDGKL